LPRFVLLEDGQTLYRLFRRQLENVDVVRTRTLDRAVDELSRSPARALVVNTSPFAAPLASREQLCHLPYGTPAVTCWVPGEDEAARQLGVVRYLTKPVSSEVLLTTLAGLGTHVRSVLLVDDEPDVLQLFARMLSAAECGYRVLRAESGHRALALLRERRPDVVLLDLVMPGMDGFQLLEEKSRDPAICEIPVVIVTSTDPTGQPLASDVLTVTCGAQLSVRELLTCIQAVSEILSPPGRSADRALSGTPGG
jgi:CheY-like chemotaxis protein